MKNLKFWLCIVIIALLITWGLGSYFSICINQNRINEERELQEKIINHSEIPDTLNNQ